MSSGPTRRGPVRAAPPAIGAPTRRALLAGGAAALLLARPARAAEHTDVELLQDLLAVERRLVTAYESALRRDAIRPALGEALLEHEREHVRALEETLAGRGSPRASVPEPALGGALRGRDGFASYALGLEREAIAAYTRAAAAFGDAELRQPLGSILACEAAHEIALRDSLGKASLLD